MPAPTVISCVYEFDNNVYKSIISFYQVSGASSIEIETSRIGGFVKIYSFTGFATTVNFSNVKSETTHSYRVRSIVSGVTSDWTSYYSVNIPAYPTSLPTDYLPVYKPQVLHQWVWNTANGTWSGQAGNCFATSVASMKEIHEKRERGQSYLSYSTGWVFGNRLPTDNQGEDMYVPEGLDRLKAEGVPKWELLPENSLRYYPDNYYYNDNVNGVAIGAKTLVNNNKATPTISADALLQRILSWEQYTTNDWLGELNGWGKNIIEVIKQRIIDDGCVLLNIAIPPSFDQLTQGYQPYISDGYIPDTVGNIRGFHVVNLIGWKVVNGRTWWIVHNNWGNWGDASDFGRAYMPLEWDYIAYFFTVEDFNNFSWSVNPNSSGGLVNISAYDWNRLTTLISAIRSSNGYPIVNFTQAIAGETEISALIFNEVRGAINEMGISNPLATTGQLIYTADFTNLADNINTIKEFM